MGKDCHCDHCDCDEDGEEKNNQGSAEEKVEKLKKAIADLGFKVEETEEGIRITE